MELFVDEVIQEKDCTYKGERYSARDNGAVLRYSRIGERVRQKDNTWTFGKPNIKTGYMEIASVRVHRIVATAFHGEPPTKEHVVDHIDTNRHNNRPGNLRWVTRLENILLNPITAKRIEMVCGSVEDFLANPAMFKDKFQEPNYSWMCNVSQEEAQTSLQRMLEWVNSDKKSSGRSLGEWIFDRNYLQEQEQEPQNARNILIKDDDNLIMAITPGAAQYNWITPTEFPCTPQEAKGKSLDDYIVNIRKKHVFCKNIYGASFIIDCGLSEDKDCIYVLTINPEAMKTYAVAKVYYERDLFVHTGHTFFTQKGARKDFTISQGLEWTGGETFDDYC